jgi:hypothetical protein
MNRSATVDSSVHPAGPLAPPRTLGQRRTRRGALALAVLLMALGGLTSGFAYVASTRTQSVLAVARTVPTGAELVAADVMTVHITADPGLKPIRAERQGDAVGKRAAVPLVPGTLLTATQLTDAPLVRPDQRQVGIGLKPDRMPAPVLHPGDRVQLVATPSDSAAASSAGPSTAPAQRFDATVVDLSGRTGAGIEGWVVYVAVAEQDAPQVVTLAAQGRLSVVLRAGG